MEKLVRDKIPEIMAKDGKQAKTRTADIEEWKKRLRDKLVEEATEYKHEPRPEELADILEVLNCLIEAEGLSLKEIETIRREKIEKKGSFNKRIIAEF